MNRVAKAALLAVSSPLILGAVLGCKSPGHHSSSQPGAHPTSAMTTARTSPALTHSSGPSKPAATPSKPCKSPAPSKSLASSVPVKSSAASTPAKTVAQPTPSSGIGTGTAVVAVAPAPEKAVTTVAVGSRTPSAPSPALAETGYPVDPWYAGIVGSLLAGVGVLLTLAGRRRS